MAEDEDGAGLGGRLANWRQAGMGVVRKGVAIAGAVVEQVNDIVQEEGEGGDDALFGDSALDGGGLGGRMRRGRSGSSDGGGEPLDAAAAAAAREDEAALYVTRCLSRLPGFI